MILRVFAIKDRKAAHYFEPFFCPTVAVAIRAFVGVAKDGSGTEISKYPADFELFEIGLYDNLKGEVVCIDPMSHGAADVLVAREGVGFSDFVVEGNVTAGK